MTQTVPATAVLGPGKTGLTIGYRVLNLDGTVYSAFSTTGVAETSTAGTYRVAGGVVAPLAGGYIVWGTSLVDYAEATVDSASALDDILEDTGTTLPAAIAAGSAGDPWSTPLPGAYGAGTAGKLLADLPTATEVVAAMDADPPAVNVTMQAGVAVAAEGARVVEGAHTVDDILRIIAAALAGETSGSGTATVEILGLDGATTRITATLDGNGNRTSMTLDGA